MLVATVFYRSAIYRNLPYLSDAFVDVAPRVGHLRAGVGAQEEQGAGMPIFENTVK